MSMRREALKSLRDAIASAVPELECHISTGQVPGNRKRKFPCLNIYPIKWKFEPEQDEIAHAPQDESRAVFNVGRHESLIQLRLSTTNMVDRAELEEKVLDYFLRREGSPGTQITTVSSIPEMGSFICSWDLEGDEWRDAKSFDHESDSLMEITATIPALVARGDVYRMDEIILGFTEDMKTIFDKETFDSSPKVERTTHDTPA